MLMRRPTFDFELGKSLATTRIELRHPVSDLILAYGSHTKFVGKAMSHEENVVFDETGNTVVKGKAASEWPEA
jgi:acyl-coenzyme A thioesterase 13